MPYTPNYPGTIKIFTEKEDKVDLVVAADMNAVQGEITAEQTELGTDVAGSCVDLKTRLYVSIGNDGAVRKGTAFPASPIAGQLFERTDLGALYIYRAAGWQLVVQYGLTTLFHFCPAAEITHSTSSVNFEDFAAFHDTKLYVPAALPSYTVTLQAYVRTETAGSGGGFLKVLVGTDEFTSAQFNNTTFAWVTFSGTITVSGWQTLDIQCKNIWTQDIILAQLVMALT